MNSLEMNKWQATLEEFVKKNPERYNRFYSDSHIEISPLYTKQMEFDDSEKLGLPASYPFTRGVQPNMYRGKLWTMRQYAGFGTAEESNERYKYLLSQGTSGLSVAFDLPTQIGYDSDNAMAKGEVGKVGVAISSIEDMEILLKDLPLDKISTSMTINSTAAILLSLYIAVARKRGISESNLSGTIQNDILKEYISRGTYIYPPKPSMRLVTDIIEYCKTNLPLWNSISISGYHIREAGANAVQELAFTFANAIAYVEAALQRKLDIDEFAPRLAFFWGCHNNLFEEVAKFRASRRIWAKIVKDRFKAKNPRSMMLRFHTQTAGCTLTAQQPDNNAVRVTVQALAAVLGGTQSLHTNATDEALGLPTERTARLALRTQQILAYESGITETVDPIGGSYYVEALTNEIEKRVWEYLEKIDKLGGAIQAIENGFFQDEISAEAYGYQREIEINNRIIVGVNSFNESGDASPQVMKVDPSLEEKQNAKLRMFRGKRDNAKVSNSLSNLSQQANSNINLIPSIIDAVENQCTLGEISDCLRLAWGEYRSQA